MPSPKDLISMMTDAMLLTPEQRSLVLRVIWVSIVSIHILWVCGLTAAIGFASPFAKASDLESVKQAVNISAKITLSRELRDQIHVMCSTKDSQARSSLAQYIEELQSQYQQITGQRYPEPPCSL